MNYWWTSDYHFSHFNIIRYCQRPFETAEEMNETIIRKHNERVKPEDMVFFLGDFIFKGGKEGDVDRYRQFEKRLNDKFIFIKGKRDRHNYTPKKYLYSKQSMWQHLVVFGIVAVLLTGVFTPASLSIAQETLNLPAPHTQVILGPAFAPPLLKGIRVYRSDPFRLDFILDKGEFAETDDQLKIVSNRLIKYFLASLTIPEEDLWVNLSPYEKDRIVPEVFGQTEMGRDLLAQDYILKQITAALLSPENKVGEEFWAKVYAEAQKQHGTADIPIDTFNKVWIIPDKAAVYENDDAAFVVESKLKVMLEEDYFALKNNTTNNKEVSSATSKLGSDIVREIVLPILEKEVNDGKNFCQLRQAYNSLILATWFKRKAQASILGQAYVDRQKIAGIDIADKNEKEKIWQQYVDSFKKGAYNCIKEEYDPMTQEILPRKYFSGGNSLVGVKDLLAGADSLFAGSAIGLDGKILELRLVPMLEASDKAMYGTRTREEFFTQFTGPVYYPASELDLDSIIWLGNLFPNLSQLVYVDILDPDEMNLATYFQPWEDDAESFSPYRYYQSEDLPLLQRQMRKKLAEFEYQEQKVIDESKTSVEIVSSTKMELQLEIAFKSDIKGAPWMNGRTIHLKFLVEDIFRYKEQFEVIFVNYPGDSGGLAEEKRFWEAVHQQLLSGGYLIETDRHKHRVTTETESFKKEHFLKLPDVASFEKDLVNLAIWKSSDESLVRDSAQPGGIDFDPSKIDLKTKNNGQRIEFDFDPDLLQKLYNAQGVKPVVIGMFPLDSIEQFMGIPNSKK